MFTNDGHFDPPHLSGSVPVLGHTVEFVRDTIELLARAQQERGEIVRLKIAHKRMVAVFGPEAHEAVFRAPDSQLNPNEAYKIMTPVFGKDIVYDAPPKKMGEQLKMLLPALRDRRMRSYGELILAEVEDSIADWGDEGEVDIVDYCRVLTNFTSSRCLLGNEFREGMTEEFARVYHDLERGVTPLAYLNAHLPIPSFRKRDRARVRLEEMISEIIAARRSNKRVGEDFLQTLMDSQYSSGAHLSEHEITGMLLAAMFAGHHTSSVTTAWSLIELLDNPHCMDEVLAELDAVYAEDRPVDYHSLREITRTEWAVKEALRLHPPLFMLVRVALQDFVYKDYLIPKGDWVIISPTVSHRMPSVFRDPLRFDPQRFGPGREEDKRDFAYIPFGGGRHKCMGNAFALLQIKAILAVLLRRYEFELVGDPIRSDFQGLVVTPAEPCRLRYKRRTTNHAKAYVPVPMGEEAKCPVTAAAAGGCPVQHAAPLTRVRVTLDTDLCRSHAVCIEEGPAIFAIGDDGKVSLLSDFSEGANEQDYEALRLAAKYCPTQAINVEEL